MELICDHERRGAMRMLPRSAVLGTMVAIVVACGAVGPSGAPSPTPGGAGRIDHATGSTDVILRYDEGGGFAGPLFFAANAPIFTLYGDGTVIFRNPMQEPLPVIGDAMPQRPFRTAKLSEDQIQSTLAYAIAEGGLGTARPEYWNDQIADASTATFTLNAGGLAKTVSVYALGLDVPGMKDVPQRAAFTKLARRLADFDGGGGLATVEYAPDRYRGFLMSAGFAGDGVARPWPWDDVLPADFVVPADPNGFGLPTTVLTVEQVEALGIDPYRGGFMGLGLLAPGGTTRHSLAVRPLLPDDIG